MIGMRGKNSRWFTLTTSIMRCNVVRLKPSYINHYMRYAYVSIQEARIHFAMVWYAAYIYNIALAIQSATVIARAIIERWWWRRQRWWREATKNDRQSTTNEHLNTLTTPTPSIDNEFLHECQQSGKYAWTFSIHCGWFLCLILLSIEWWNVQKSKSIAVPSSPACWYVRSMSCLAFHSRHDFFTLKTFLLLNKIEIRIGRSARETRAQRTMMIRIIEINLRMGDVERDTIVLVGIIQMPSAEFLFYFVSSQWFSILTLS